MRLVSWNVNGLRAIAKKGFDRIFEQLDADIFALQETKLQEGQIDMEFEGYRSYWSYAQKKGYSGTAVFTKREPLRVLHGLGVEHLDTEGRIVALEFPEFWFVNVYTPRTSLPASTIAWNGMMPSVTSARAWRRGPPPKALGRPTPNPW